MFVLMGMYVCVYTGKCVYKYVYDVGLYVCVCPCVSLLLRVKVWLMRILLVRSLACSSSSVRSEANWVVVVVVVVVYSENSSSPV